MNIFEKRPLSLILCIMLGGFSLFANLDINFKIVIAVASLALFAISFIFKYKSPGRIKIMRILLIAFSLSVMLSALWSFLFYPRKYHDEKVIVEGRVYEIDTSSYNSKIILKSDKISSNVDTHKFILFIDRDSATKVKKYDTLKVEVSLQSLDKLEDENQSYYISSGISGYLTDLETIVVTGNQIDKIDDFLTRISLKLTNTLKKRTNYETGAFLAALIIGNREDLDGNTRLNFSRAGISHILALSGMHLAILSLALSKILLLLKINKKLRTIIISLLTVIYMAITGFSPSVLRSGIMLIISGILYLLSRSKDSVTSLFIAVTVILIFTPHAVFDLSLWLSAFATLGVIIFADYDDAHENTKGEINIGKQILIIIKNGILVSLFAFGSTFAISAFNFKTFSVISLFTTLIFSFLVEIFIYLGLLTLLLGWFLPIGKLLVAFSDMIKLLAENLSSFKFIYVSAESIVTTLLLTVFTLFFFAFLILKTDKKKLCIIIICVLMIASFSVAMVDTYLARSTDDVVYSPNSSGDAFMIKSNGYISIVYSGKQTTNSSYATKQLLTYQRITYLDTLVLSNYSYTTVQFCEYIISSIKTDTILIPIPSTAEELNQAEGLADLLSLYGTRMKFYNTLNEVRLGEFSYVLFDKLPYKYGEYPMNVFRIYDRTDSFTYISSGKYTDVSPDAKAEIYNCENLFIGSGNSYYKFNMILPKIKSINFSNTSVLSQNAKEYYKNINSEINYFEVPESIYK